MFEPLSHSQQICPEWNRYAFYKKVIRKFNKLSDVFC